MAQNLNCQVIPLQNLIKSSLLSSNHNKTTFTKFGSAKVVSLPAQTVRQPHFCPPLTKPYKD